MTDIVLPIEYFNDPTTGDPLNNAQIFIGNPDVDPTVPANQKQVSARQESGTIVNVAQPIRTGAGGRPIYQGSPVSLSVAGNYSITVRTSTDAQVYKQTSVSNPDSPLSVLYTDSGAANAYVLTAVAGATPTEYVQDMVVMFRGDVANTSTSVTIQLPGLDPVQTDVNLPNTIRPDTLVKYRYDATGITPTFRRELFKPTVRGHDAGLLVAGEDGVTELGRSLRFNFAAGNADSDVDFQMTDADNMNIVGLTPSNFAVGGVTLQDLTSVLSHGTAGATLTGNTPIAGSSLRTQSFYIPAGGGPVTAPAPQFAVDGTWLPKDTATGLAGNHAAITCVRIA